MRECAQALQVRLRIARIFYLVLADHQIRYRGEEAAPLADDIGRALLCPPGIQQQVIAVVKMIVPLRRELMRVQRTFEINRVESGQLRGIKGAQFLEPRAACIGELRIARNRPVGKLLVQSRVRAGIEPQRGGRIGIIVQHGHGYPVQ